MEAPDSRPADARKERARANRRRMVEAAYRLFSERGWTVPLTAIAQEAGVAVQTLYFTFHTKVGLLQEALQLAVLGDEQPIPPHERPWFHQMAAEPDPRRAIEIIVENTQEIFVRVAPLAAVFKSGDPEVSEMWAHSEQLRLDGYRKLVDTLSKKGGLKPGTTRDEHVDVLFVLLGPEMYWAVVAGRGWSPQRWQAWITAVLADALLPA
jgi:AcrR family transcriptional regulator